MASTTRSLFNKRRNRTRFRIRSRANGKPRLSVFRSNKHIHAQIIDDVNGVTLAAASSIEKDLRAGMPKGSDKAAAAAVGKMLAERAVAAGIGPVVFDRGGYAFHGRVKALADAAREAGLQF